jgi:hypothetical protein
MSKNSEMSDEPQEQKIVRTGKLGTVYSIRKDHIGHYRTGYSEAVREDVFERLGKEVLKRIADNREYLVRMLPATTTMDGDTLVFRQEAVTLLLDPEVAEIGEYVPDEAFDYEGEFNIGETETGLLPNGFVYVPEKIGDYDCWKRIE